MSTSHSKADIAQTPERRQDTLLRLFSKRQATNRNDCCTRMENEHQVDLLSRHMHRPVARLAVVSQRASYRPPGFNRTTSVSGTLSDTLKLKITQCRTKGSTLARFLPADQQYFSWDAFGSQAPASHVHLATFSNKFHFRLAGDRAHSLPADTSLAKPGSIARHALTGQHVLPPPVSNPSDYSTRKADRAAAKLKETALYSLRK
jgi:hypothetical protein